MSKRLLIFFLGSLFLNFLNCNLFIAEEDTLTILFTADIRGKLKSVRTSEEYLGDLAILKTLALREKAFSEHALLVDAGDWTGLQGENLFIHFLRARLIMDAFGKIGYDAITPGEMDFFFGVQFLKKEAEKNNVPIVLANLFDANGNNPFIPYIIKKFERRKVLLTGVLHPGVVVEGYFLEPPVLTLQRIADVARKENVDVVVVLSHLGYSNDQGFFPMVEGVDVVVSAHSEEYLTAPGVAGKALILKSTIRGQHLGKLQLRISGKRPFNFVQMGLVSPTTVRYDLIAVKPTVAPPNPVMEKFIETYFDKYAGLSELSSRCLPCHAERITRWLEGPHSKNRIGCTYCHDVPDKHLTDKSKFLNRDSARAVCSSCHNYSPEKVIEILKNMGCSK